MNSISRLTIENFQSHRKTVIEPAPSGQLTVIVGPSDSGKTAIIRALRWLLFNIPQGDDFIRVGATLCRVTLELESGHKIIRERTKGGVNRYKIIDPGADKPEIYEGFGNTVPLEVRELTGVQYVTIGDITLNLNMSEQLDGPFLGSSVSSGARARILGKLAGTEEVDHANKVLGTDLFRAKQEEKRLSNELAELNEKISEYDYLPEMARRIAQIEKLYWTVKKAQVRLDELKTLKSLINNANSIIISNMKIVRKFEHLEKAEDDLNTALVGYEQLLKLSSIREKLIVIEEGINNAANALDRVKNISIAEDIVNTAEKGIERRRRLKEISNRLETANRTISIFSEKAKRCASIPEAEQLFFKSSSMLSQRDNIISLRNQLKNAEDNVAFWQRKAALFETQIAEYEGAYKDALLAEGRCPACGSDINPEKLKEVI